MSVKKELRTYILAPAIFNKKNKYTVFQQSSLRHELFRIISAMIIPNTIYIFK